MSLYEGHDRDEAPVAITPFFETEEYRQLQHQRDALFHSPGNLDRNRPEIAIVDQKLADGYWHHNNPGKTGSWRIAHRDGTIVAERQLGDGIPRFESEADCAAWIDARGHSHSLKPVERKSRQTLAALDARIAPIAVAA